jgi:hypothetical protein
MRPPRASDRAREGLTGGERRLAAGNNLHGAQIEAVGGRNDGCVVMLLLEPTLVPPA